MYEKKVVVKADTGVHARPAMTLVRKATKYKSKINLIKDETEADAKSIMSLLALAILKGTSITIRASGEDEQEAVEALWQIIENDFQEIS